MDDHNQTNTGADEQQPTEAQAPGVHPPADRLYKALANRTRRQLLLCLLDHAVKTVDEAADAVVGVQSTIHDNPLGPTDRNTVKTQLYHRDIPLLTEMGLVRQPTPDEIQLARVADPVRDTITMALDYDDQIPFTTAD